MQWIGSDDYDLSENTTVFQSLTACLIRSSSPGQLRIRVSRAFALVRSFPTFSLLQRRKQPSCSESSTQSPFIIEPLSTPPPISPELQATAATPRPPYRRQTTPTAASIAPGKEDNATTPIENNYAQQGLSLLQTSLHEYPHKPIFARQLYIHALIYLLQGLPPLSEAEIASLRFALPPCLLVLSPTTHTSSDDKKDDEIQRDASTSEHDHATPPPSLLHRTLSTTVFFLLSLIRFLTPYIRHLLSTFRYYDREYNIHHRAFSCVVTVMRRVWDLTISNMDPGYLIWLVAEISTGAVEGWRQAMERNHMD
ncbi:MAG: hypothetical protein L6R40_007369 [Gallowayella cf. fulva]|nr:MAG: hypothetical protein L6R40_007369 [Xanthomendoza cf. fulva]